MKKILFILCFLSFKAYAQEPNYVPMKSNYLFRGIKMDSLLIAPVYPDTPTATTKVNFAGSVVRVGSNLYMRNPQLTQWVDLSSAGGGGSTDTTSLSNRINNKVDSITKVSDSVKYWKNGTSYFAFKDSTGGGNLTLNQVTDFGNTTQNDIIFVDDADLRMDTFSGVIFANNSRVQEGYIDAGYGGNHGVALVCGLGYEYKWEGGRLFVMNSSSNLIREAKYMFTDIPDSSKDYTEGYQIGSRWILDNGDTYVCTDNSSNAAVWVLQPNAFDSTSLSNRIDNKVDSVTKSTDSVKYWKNGSPYYAFTDASGGQNGRWGNDTALVILAKVHNGTGTTLSRGTVVMISGSNGDVASVILANNKYDSTSARTIGLVKDPINSGDTGWVVTQGQASKLNLGSYTAGDVLYLDSIDGGLTKTKPIAPYHQVFVCIVERANNGNGLAYVKPLNFPEISELHDAQIINPLNNQVLVYSDTQQLWKNRNVYSIVDTTSLSNRINGINLQKVTDAGNQTSLDIYANSYFLYDSIGGAHGKLENVDGSFFYKDVNEVKTFASEIGTFQIYNANGFPANLQPSLLTVGRGYNFPDKAGTFILDADTASMLTNYQRASSFPIATFGAGSGAAGDTSAFTTAAIYGSFYLNAGSDTIIVTGYTGVVQGTSASVTPTIYFNDSLNVTAGATKIVNSPSAVTSTTTGNTVTSLDNTKIPPGNFVWVKTETVTTKPTYFNLTLIGYRKR